MTQSQKDSIKLTFTDKAQVVGITALLAAAFSVLGVLGLRLFIPERGILSNQEDAPIVMAGGSFHVCAGGDGKWEKRNTDKKLVHSKKSNSKKMLVSSIDVIGPTGKLTQIKGIDTTSAYRDIIFKYCENLTNCSPVDLITLSFHNEKNDTFIEISDSQGRIWYATQTPDEVWHHPEEWTLASVDLNGLDGNKVVECGDSGHCTLIIHTCEKGPCKP
jgi:hypothetical protein